MDVRDAFLRAASSLLPAYMELSSFRVVGLTSQLALLDIHVRNPAAYANIELHAIKELKSIGGSDYSRFSAIFDESSLVLAFTWLESFLADVEEAIYLTSPNSLGEQVQVKLGKVLGASSMEELIHDIARKRVRDRGGWSLTNRIRDLADNHQFAFTNSTADFDWLSDTRNRIVHNRRFGGFRVAKKRVEFKWESRSTLKSEEIRRFLRIAWHTVADLYAGTCKTLKITGRFPMHKANRDVIYGWRKMWIDDPKKPEKRIRRKAAP